MARTGSKTGAAATGSAAGSAAGSASPVGGAKGAFDPMSLLNKAASKAGSSEKKGGSKKEDRTILTLSPEGVAALIAFGEAKQIGDICEHVEDQHGAAVKQEALDLFTSQMWSTRSVPTNPVLVAHGPDGRTVDVSAMFLVKASFRPNRSVPAKDKREEGRSTRDYIFDALTMSEDGLDDADAIRLIDSELDLAVSVGFKNMTVLLNGKEERGTWKAPTPEEQAAANKLLQVILDPGRNGRVSFDAFTDEERMILLDQDDSKVRMRDSKGFLNRVMSYCRSLGQLRHVLSIIPPDLALTQTKMGESLGVSALADRRRDAAQHVLGLAPDA